MTRMDWSKARRKRGEKSKRKKKPKPVHPNSMAARKMGRRVWWS